MVDVNARRRLCTLVAAAFIDGKFGQEERAVIRRKGGEMGFSPAGIDEIIELGRKGALAISVPPTQKLKEDLLEDLIDVVCADGRIEPGENHLLMKFAGQLGLQVHDLGERVRRRLGQGRRPAPQPAEAEVVVIDEPAPPKTPGGFFHQHGVAKPEPRRAPQPPPPPSKPPAEAFPIAPQPALVGGPELLGVPERLGEPLTQRPAGPVRLDDPQLAVNVTGGSLGMITLELVRQRLLLEGRESAALYLKEFCGVSEPAEAARIVEEIARKTPELSGPRA